MFWVIYKIVLVVLVFEFLAFLYFIKAKRQDIADVLWGPTFVLIALIAAYISGTFSVTSLAVNLIVIIWATRLAWHIWQRHKRGGEDQRYKEISKEWGELFYVRAFFQTFLLQGLLAILVSLPVIIINVEAWDFSWQFFVGLAIWIFGFTYEVIADRQLTNFIKQGKDGIMKEGLWKFSRHPNYFGEITMWLGIFVIATGTFGSWQLAIIGPLTITILISFISGVPLLEKRYKDNDEYREYKQATSVLVPWWKLKE